MPPGAGDSTVPVVAVIGAGHASPAQEQAARAVGSGLARAGITVVTGGLGGVMAAACQGARQAGGRTVGILPGLDRRAANAFVEVALPTGLGEARNLLVVRAADVVIAVGGEYGTLSELALALKAGIPVIGLDTWQLRRDGRDDDGVEVAASAEDAVARARAHLARSG